MSGKDVWSTASQKAVMSISQQIWKRLKHESNPMYRGKRVRFYSTVDLVNLLECEKHGGKARRIAQALLRMDVVILDELGYLLFSQVGGAQVFHLLSKLYEHTSVAITTNLSFAG